MACQASSDPDLEDFAATEDDRLASSQAHQAFNRDPRAHGVHEVSNRRGLARQGFGGGGAASGGPCLALQAREFASVERRLLSEAGQ